MGQAELRITVSQRASFGEAKRRNTWIKAQRFGKDYWLYVVVNCKTKPELYLIQDLASKLNPKEEVNVVWYMVPLTNLKNASSKG